VQLASRGSDVWGGKRGAGSRARGSAAAAVAVLWRVQLACLSAFASPVACAGGSNAGRERLVRTSVQVCLGGS